MIDRLALAALVLLAAALAADARGTYRTRAHVTRSGTYVQPHYSTTPNRSRYDNFSTQGNVNPYTGKSGTVNPYRVRRRP